MVDNPRILSICSGIDGLPLAVRIVFPGAITKCHVEREITVAQILAVRMEEASIDCCPVWSDLRTFDGNCWRGHVDWVVASIPCQGISVVGLCAATALVLLLRRFGEEV